MLRANLGNYIPEHISGYRMFKLKIVFFQILLDMSIFHVVEKNRM